MVMTHLSSTALSKSSLSFELQSFLLRSSVLRDKCLEQIDLLRLNGFVIYFTDFTHAKMILQRGTVYLNFKERNCSIAALGQEVQGMLHSVQIPYIPALKGKGLRYVR